MRTSTRPHSGSCSPTPGRPPPSRTTSSSPGRTARSQARVRRPRRPEDHAGAPRDVHQRGRVDLDRVVPHALREHGREPRPAGRSTLGTRGRPDRRCLVPCPARRRDRERRDRGLPWLGDDHMKRIISILAAAIAIVALALDHDGRRPDEGRSAHDLRGGVADRGLQGVRQRAALQLRRLERARDPDQERRTGRHLRLGRAGQHAAALRRGHRRQAGHLHGQPARADRAEVESRPGSSRSTT